MGIRWLHLAAITLLCAAAPARAETQFGLVCVGTETDETIAFEFRWEGESDWQPEEVGPDDWALFGWRYDHPGQNASPTAQVRYDDDLGPGVNYVVTDLEVYAAESRDCEAEGKTYNFHARGSELFIGAVD